MSLGIFVQKLICIMQFAIDSLRLTSSGSILSFGYIQKHKKQQEIQTKFYEMLFFMIKCDQKDNLKSHPVSTPSHPRRLAGNEKNGRSVADAKTEKVM